MCIGPHVHKGPAVLGCIDSSINKLLIENVNNLDIDINSDVGIS